MTISGHIYGVVLNDKPELEKLASAFEAKPYAAPPQAPVVYMKPSTTIARGPIAMAASEALVASSTLAILFARDASRCSRSDALGTVGAMALAIDISEPQPDYYRPAVSRLNRDGFLVLGEWGAPLADPASLRIETEIDGEMAHGWSLDRLHRDPAQLIADLSDFMTLRAGDMLLVGLPGDAPIVRAGQSIMASAPETSLSVAQALFVEKQS